MGLNNKRNTSEYKALEKRNAKKSSIENRSARRAEARAKQRAQQEHPFLRVAKKGFGGDC